ncbi:MAG TPA: riboflavin synthase [Sphingobium sp.]|uniref:riboflavin synthase n=1 Tax=Sphingobium sp. TaxID=1912891 RepID=UPI002ED4D61E
MFTGIITDIGTIRTAEQRGDLRLTIDCAYDMDSVAIGASIACSGACLTVVSKCAHSFTVDLSAETVARTAHSLWAEGGKLNLERAAKVGDELGGHIVTGHVDGIGSVVSVEPDGDSHRVRFQVPPAIAPLIAPKGSITVDGVSLTVNEVEDRDGVTTFTVNLIPHTWEVTTFGSMAPGRPVNLEIDILARYLARMRSYVGA